MPNAFKISTSPICSTKTRRNQATFETFFNFLEEKYLDDDDTDECVNDVIEYCRIVGRDYFTNVDSFRPENSVAPIDDLGKNR